MRPIRISIVVVALAACFISSCAEPTQAPRADAKKEAVPDKPVEKPLEKPAPVEPIKEVPAAAEPVATIEQPVEAPPADRPAAPPRALIAVGEAEIMSDRLDEAMAEVPNIPAGKLAGYKKSLYKRWIQDELITSQLAKTEVTDEEIEAEQGKLVGWSVERQMRNEYRKKTSEARKKARAAEKAAESQPTTGTRPAAQTRPAPVEMPPRPTAEQIEARKEEALASPDQKAKIIQEYMAQQKLDEEKLVKKFRYNIFVARASTPEKVDEFIKSHPVSFFDGTKAKASHVLIATEFYDPPEVKEAARKKLAAVAEQIANGTISFEDAAKENSDCPSAPRGGDLGEFPLLRMVPPFASAVDSLKVGEISDPVETFFGWHIIKLTGRTEGSGTVAEGAARTVERMLKGTAVRQLLTESMKENPVTIHEPILDSPVPAEQPKEQPALESERHGP